jgi:SAM-dependent methyltransferase
LANWSDVKTAGVTAASHGAHMVPISTTVPGAAQAIDGLDRDELRRAIRDEYALVATEPARGFHFHTGRPLAALLGYEGEWLDGIPESTIASFAGTGNPFALGTLNPGEFVVDVGSGAGIDSLIASKMVGPTGRVRGVDMTAEMLDRATASADEMNATNVEFSHGYAEQLPVPDSWADVVISNGVMNLFPDKLAGLREMGRALKPGGRLQIGDILVSKTVPMSAKRDIDLWKG